MNKPSQLVNNTIFLYLLTFSNYIFGLITLPYETRILGPESFGILGFAASFYTYFFIILDFGFILSGTKLIAESSNNKHELSKLVTGITCSKLILFLLLLICFSAICFSVDYLKQNYVLLLLYLIYAGLTSLIPDYLYRGLENMKMVTFRTIIVRFIFTCLIFIFLKRPDQYYLVPLFNIIGTFFALSWIIYDIYKNIGLRFVKISIRYVISLIKSSFPFFLSRIASTIYSASNTIIMGFVYPNANVLGYYTSADKVRGLASQAASPIADSFYPYMLRTKDFSKMLKSTAVMEILIIAGCVVLWIYSEFFCVLVFGEEFRDSANILRCMIPLMAIILPSYMFGFPALSPLGKARWANLSVELALLNQIIGLLILICINAVNVYTLIGLTFISECVCLITRIIAFYNGYKNL